MDAVACPFAGVIFDLDGTLYDQSALRRRMAWELARYYLLRPWRGRELWLLSQFRRWRERLAEAGEPNIARQQYVRPAQALGIPPERLERLVEEWLQRRPIRHLRACGFSITSVVFGWLAAQGCRVAVLSDYVPQAKLSALGLAGHEAWCSTDPAIDRLKPDPSGIHHICRQWGLAPESCLMIGDREERDGEAARRAGAAALIVPKGLDFASLGAFQARLQRPRNAAALRG